MRNSCRFSWTRLSIGMAATLVLGLGTHVTMMTVLHVSYPYNPPKSGFLLYVNEALIVFGSITLYQLTLFDKRLSRLSLRIACTFLLLTMITERLIRDAAMNGFVTSAYIYASLEVLPKLLLWLVLSTFVCLAARFCVAVVPRAVGSAIIGAVVFLVVKPAIDAYFANVLQSFAYLDHAPVYGFPYGWQVTTAAFITYIEPVTACLFASWLIFDRLPGGTTQRILAFAGIIVLIRGSAIGWLAYGIKYADHFLTALVSSGQFALESLVLGLLTGITWCVAQKPVIDFVPRKLQSRYQRLHRTSREQENQPEDTVT